MAPHSGWQTVTVEQSASMLMPWQSMQRGEAQAIGFERRATASQLQGTQGAAPIRPPLHGLEEEGSSQGDQPVVEGLAFLNKIVLVKELFERVVLPVKNAIHLQPHQPPRRQCHGNASSLLACQSGHLLEYEDGTNKPPVRPAWRQAGKSKPFPV